MRLTLVLGFWWCRCQRVWLDWVFRWFWGISMSSRPSRLQISEWMRRNRQVAHLLATFLWKERIFLSVGQGKQWFLLYSLSIRSQGRWWKQGYDADPKKRPCAFFLIFSKNIEYHRPFSRSFFFSHQKGNISSIKSKHFGQEELLMELRVSDAVSCTFSFLPKMPSHPHQKP